MRIVLVPVVLLGLLLTGCGEPELPNPADFAAAGPGCQSKKNVSPWVGTPAAARGDVPMRVDGPDLRRTEDVQVGRTLRRHGHV